MFHVKHSILSYDIVSRETYTSSLIPIFVMFHVKHRKGVSIDALYLHRLSKELRRPEG